ncbi:MAG: AMP-binding protein, partial [Cyclobacteriaceae bacterium]
RLTPNEIDYLITNSSPALLIAEKKFETTVKGLTSNVDILWMDEIFADLGSVGNETFDSVEIEEDHPLFILYTSGTTGFPKGAVYSHKMLFWNSMNLTQSLSVTSDDHTITCMPPFHTGGWNVLLTPMLHRGASVGIFKKFDPDWILKLMEEEGRNIFMGVPTMLKMMSESSEFDRVTLRNMRYFIVGGEALPLPVISTWHEKGIKIRQGYGMTEVGPNLTSLHHDDAERKKGSIGLPNFYVDIKLVDEKGNEIIGPGTGELCISGPVVTPGYWNNDEATRKAIRDNWFHSGDMARIDDEGYLYIVDRIKSMYISGGENVYPAEVERVLCQLEGVEEAVVIGVPDQKWGEVGKAIIRTAANEELPDEIIFEHCCRYLAKFKVPKYIMRVSDLPKNASGKTDREEIRKKYAEKR